MRHVRMLLLVAVAATTVSCSEGDLLTAPTPSARVDGTWTLVQLNASGLSLEEPKATSRFAFTLAGDRCLLRADCNTCAGEFQLAGDALTVRLDVCTRNVCVSAPLDAQVQTALNGTHTARLDASRLQLTSARGEIRFER